MFPRWCGTEPTTLFGSKPNREMSPQIRVIKTKTDCYRLIERMNVLFHGKRTAIILIIHTAEKRKITGVKVTNAIYNCSFKYNSST